MSASRPPMLVRTAVAGLLLVLVLLLLAALRADTARAAAGMPITVDKAADQLDTSPGDGECRTFGGGCSLRAAIMEANAAFGPDTIVIEPGVYELEIPTVNDDLDATGDFDVHGSVNFVGAGEADTVIDGGFPVEADPEAVGLDRLFEIHPTAVRVTFSDLTLREGYVAGGGINNADPFDYEWLPTDPIPMPPPGRIEIVSSTLSGNGAGGGGAAVHNVSSGYVSIVDSTVSDNPGPMIQDPLDPEEMIPAPGVYEPESSPLEQAGAYDGAGTIRVTGSVVADNFANPEGGGTGSGGHTGPLVQSSTNR